METERELTKIFRQIVDLVGFDIANRWYDSCGLNGDFVHTEQDVEDAKELLELARRYL